MIKGQVGAKTYHTHALPGCDESGDADEKANCGEDTPGPTGRAESQENGSDEASNDTSDAQTTSEDDARSVAVADRPANEVGMGLVAERPFYGADDVLESGGVGGDAKSVDNGLSLLVGQVQLTGSSVNEVDGDDSIDLLTERLDGDWRRLAGTTDMGDDIYTAGEHQLVRKLVLP